MSLCPTPGAAMVLLASGIVDETLCRSAGAPQYYPPRSFGSVGGVEPGASGVGRDGADTLLSFEGSGN
jgi:hypothetical protein